MIKYSEEYFKKSFTADTMKNAYLSAIKWYATNILSKDEFADTHLQIVKNDEGKSPTVTLHLFAFLDGEQDVMEKHCECCKAMHKSFFINEETNCNICTALGFQRRLEGKIKVKKDYYKELLRKNI